MKVLRRAYPRIRCDSPGESRLRGCEGSAGSLVAERRQQVATQGETRRRPGP